MIITRTDGGWGAVILSLKCTINGAMAFNFYEKKIKTVEEKRNKVQDGAVFLDLLDPTLTM